jgi:cysteinyl-tRNA synthetase
MKKSALTIALVIVTMVLLSCRDDGSNYISLSSRDYRQDMRNFVQDISAYAKEINPDFVVIPQLRRIIFCT